MIAIQPAAPSPGQTIEMPPSGQSVARELAALLTGAGVAPLTDRAFLRVTGSDATRWLNGMVTNSIQSLKPGQGNYNFLLNAQGRIQGDVTAFALADSFLLETDSDRLPPLIALLDRYIIMDDVELELMETRAGLLLTGPQAEAILVKLGIDISLPQMHMATAHWLAEDFPVIHAHSPLFPRWELWAGKSFIPILTEELLQAGATLSSPDALEHLRILEGTPLYGTDIRNSETARDLPQETGQTRALHFTKGCYLGQEIVERIHSRGNVHRAFGGFELHGSLPASGTLLTSDGKPAGELTSVAAIPLPGAAAPIQLALGYARREALERGQPLEYPGGTATPVGLPYPVFQ